jgi:hypothetical protein
MSPGDTKKHENGTPVAGICKTTRGIALRERMAYGTIAAEVVTHRRLLQMCCSLNMGYTMGQSLKGLFHNKLENCPVVNLLVRSNKEGCI